EAAAAQKKVDDFAGELQSYADDKGHFSKLGTSDADKYTGQIEELQSQVKNKQISVEDAKTRFEEIKKEVKKQSDIDSCASAIQKFSENSKSYSGLSTSQKETFTKQLQELADKVQSGQISTSEAETQWKGIQKKMGNQVAEDKKIQGYK